MSLTSWTTGRLERLPGLCRHGLRQALQTGMDLVYPPQCAFCRADMAAVEKGILLCDACHRELVPVRRAVCFQCGATVGNSLQHRSRCHHCRGQQWRFRTVVGLGSYRGLLRQAVLRMKRLGAEPLAAALGGVLVDEHREELTSLAPSVVVPVPMHWTRRWQRGVNSPDLLAPVVAKRLGVPVAARSLVRSHRTVPQYDVLPEERAANILGAFRVTSSFDFHGASVLLVDDVLTTGATANEAAKVLRAAGAERVAVAVVARADGRR